MASNIEGLGAVVPSDQDGVKAPTLDTVWEPGLPVAALPPELVEKQYIHPQRYPVAPGHIALQGDFPTPTPAEW